MSMTARESSIPAVVGERARQQPDARAFTFIDYEVDPAGYSQSLTWSQVHKDVLIVDRRNHYPDDIEATIQEITGGRAVAISVPNDRSEQLVAIVELKKRGSSEGEVLDRLHTVKLQVTSAISKSHGLRVADLVLVPPGSIPITTSGKVRRSACAERYRQDEFTRLDTPA
jgi:acyl-CoA synthetase (AMP-forming)/AMP-acid ligase II